MDFLNEAFLFDFGEGSGAFRVGAVVDESSSVVVVAVDDCVSFLTRDGRLA